MLLGSALPAQQPADSNHSPLLSSLDEARRARNFTALDSTTIRGVSDAITAGKYADAIATMRASVERADARAQQGYLRMLASSGYDSVAEADARRWPTAATALGDLLASRGRPDEAKQAYERALASKASDSLTARIGLAALALRRGDRESARAQWRRVITATADGARLTAEQWVAVGDAQRGLADDDKQRFQLAVQAYERAAAENPADPQPKLREGALFLEKYNTVEAKKSFDAVLRANPRNPVALLGLARLRAFEGGAGALALAESSLVTNPRYVDARLFVAAARLDAEDYAAAQREVEQALAVDSVSLDALTLSGAVRSLRGDWAGTRAIEQRVLAIDPHHAAFYATLADLAARHRQYAAAARLAEQGVALDPRSWRSHALRGTNQMRLGHVDSARTSLEAAFAGDPYDVWTANTLKLLDAMKGYRESRTAHFTIVADSSEDALLALYLGDLLESGYAEFAKRYGYTPKEAVRLELFRSHADFSVRSVGLTGLGALGISFGPVLAMDAPSARNVGEFHWGATAWHELAHTFTLGLTNDRVPRWLSEGLSMLEERRGHAGWGDGPTPAFLKAYVAGAVPPPSRLNDGFVRPKFPEQVIFSYYAASLVCELIERDFGASATSALLAAFRDGLDTPGAIKRALGIDMAALDQRYDAYVTQRFGGVLAALRGGDEGGGYVARLDSAVSLGADSLDAAVKILERAKALFPDYAAGDDNAYWRLAALYEQAGRAKQAADELARLVAHNASHYPAQRKLAELRATLGDTASAAAALEQAIWVSPYDPQVHQRLATYYTRLGDRTRAVRERRAVLALAPTDVADARFQLAQALFDAGDRAAAKREVLQALERAPSFAPAQELLLKLVGDTP